MDLHHSLPRKRSKSFRATSRDIALFAHPVHAETVPMDIDRPEHATQDSATLMDSPGVTVANSGILHHEESHISPEERRFEAYTRSIVPAPNTQDTATNDLFAYHMPKFESVEELSLYCATYFSLNKSQMPQLCARAVMLLEEARYFKESALNSWEMIEYAHGGTTSVEFHVYFYVRELVELTDKMKLEIQMYLPWGDLITLAEVMAPLRPLRNAGFELSVTVNEEQWAEIPSQYRDFHKALTIKAITGAELDAANLRFQQDMPQFIADDLTAHDTHGFRPNKRRWHSSLA
ncbi:uncharacterized protein FOBCDRAFT_259997 [Fusarium oxysporum Fo47]|uniref:Uncharacterized protein n=1 Tax=Fusarium oxysporum Fo47 TaxID=660027 RepID=W9KEB8_FUSOX|nr:uncharacterized protein FOBCDRAFT_259997 [Fusarium oxysporum Fo47]EWZ42732.1 hypothetical protein FOZG_07563 [Fusarium oxysporum Fo47]QKD53284.1 hypothetical protein FOBCDRAFT_259997 [Fusarium oxysporum Fo47]